MVEKTHVSWCLNTNIHTDYPITSSITQLTKNSPLQAQKDWVCRGACGLIFSYFKK
ncbi:hypothetical protein SAMN05444724_2950 [Salinivibrio sp. ES.052]|nr:hypothetical protein SAMN05444724_2950 [Salinivibrio sp. ES.052]